jgi:hypothetical protein
METKTPQGVGERVVDVIPVSKRLQTMMTHLLALGVSLLGERVRAGTVLPVLTTPTSMAKA